MKGEYGSVYVCADFETRERITIKTSATGLSNQREGEREVRLL
jgi:hypothetical protein